MAAAWDLSDDTLYELLNEWRGYIVGQSWYIGLYQNDPTIEPGIVIGDLEEADFPGYSRFMFNTDDWGTVSVVDHVAIMTLTVAGEFEADNTPFSPQTIYGYFLIDGDDNMELVSKFDTPRVIFPATILNVTPQMKVRTCPP